MAWAVSPSALVALVPDLSTECSEKFQRCALQGDQLSLDCFSPMRLVAMDIGVLATLLTLVTLVLYRFANVVILSCESTDVFFKFFVFEFFEFTFSLFLWLYFRLSAGIRVLCHRDLARFFSATILYFN
jgi:hypothetical protein